jgi:tRNA nucleotidyltransferase (CCA-adding enzyme)
VLRREIAGLREVAPWLFAPELCTCVVGSAALVEACARAGLEPPAAEDLDLAWALDPDAGRALLDRHGVGLPTTEGSRDRGTLAFRAGGGRRIEITTFRGAGRSPAERIEQDLGRRDMTIGAIAWWLAEDRIVDPSGGLDDWRAGRIEPVGEALERIAEHPIRYLRWFRRAHELGFELSRKIRRLRFDPAWFEPIPREALAAELRRALDRLRSPGALLVELHEAGALASLAAELAPQFDGRPAGPLRHHPELGQGLHLVLALEWAAARARDLPAADRNAVMVAVLTHDLGKNLTRPADLPSHPGHEGDGVPLVRSLLDRLPGLTDPRGRKLAEQVCRLHLLVRRLGEMRGGTLAGLYERELRGADFPLPLFALAVGADVGGRLGREAEGEAVRAQVEAELGALRQAAAAVDARPLREAHGEDLDGFKQALHRARAVAIRRALRGGGNGD